MTELRIMAEISEELAVELSDLRLSLLNRLSGTKGDYLFERALSVKFHIKRL